MITITTLSNMDLLSRKIPQDSVGLFLSEVRLFRYEARLNANSR